MSEDAWINLEAEGRAEALQDAIRALEQIASMNHMVGCPCPLYPFDAEKCVCHVGYAKGALGEIGCWKDDERLWRWWR